MLVENDLSVELVRALPPKIDCSTIHPHHWSPPPRDCLKLNVDAGFHEGDVLIVVLARNEVGKVDSLWFEQAKFSSTMLAKAKAIYNACVISKSKSHLKILIESDCKVVIDVVLGHNSCP